MSTPLTIVLPTGTKATTTATVGNVVDISVMPKFKNGFDPKTASPSELAQEMIAIVKYVAATTSDAVAYNGFDVIAFRKMILSKWEGAQIVIAIVVLLQRGNNIDNFRTKGTSDSGTAVMNSLVTWGVVKTRVDGMTITLSRVGASFPLEMLIAAGELAKEGKLRSLITLAQKKELTTKHNLVGKIPPNFFVPGISGIVPGLWADLYMDFTDLTSDVFNATPVQKLRTAKLVASLGGNLSICTWKDAADTWNISNDMSLVKGDDPSPMDGWKAVKTRYAGNLSTPSLTTAAPTTGTATTKTGIVLV